MHFTDLSNLTNLTDGITENLEWPETNDKWNLDLLEICDMA